MRNPVYPICCNPKKHGVRTRVVPRGDPEQADAELVPAKGPYGIVWKAWMELARAVDAPVGIR